MMAITDDRPLSPKKEMELFRIELLRKSLCRRIGGEIRVVATPDEDEVDQQQRPCDALLEGEGIRFAVELTTIDSYTGQRFDDDRFRRVMGALEKRVGAIPDWVEMTIDVGAIPSGYDWSELSRGIEQWLLEHLQELAYDNRDPVEMAGIPFVVWVRREHGWGKGCIRVMRHVPVEIEEQRSAVIRRAIENKRGVLSHYKSEGYTTVLLLERYDVALANRNLICETFHNVSPLELCADAIDDVYLVETPTTPWAISPLKIGSEILDEPCPEWPDAPGYPHLDMLDL